MDITRQKILEADLGLPSYQKFKNAIGSKYTELADRMFQAMFHNYLKDKGSVSLTYWADRFDNALILNKVLISLSKAGWITSHSIPARNWGEAHINEEKLLEYVSPDELEITRASKKYFQYVLKLEESTKTNITRVNGKKKNTGLVREGFAKAGNTVFSYDKNYLEEYKEVVGRNLTKSMDKIAQQCPNLRHDRASYDKISLDILEYYLTSDHSYTAGDRDHDSRGRNIQGNLDKVGNPISSKDFRSLLVIE